MVARMIEVGSVHGDRAGRLAWWAGPVLAAALTLTAVSAAQAAPPEPPASEHVVREAPAPLHLAGRAGVPGHYIVVLEGRLPKKPTKQSMKKAWAADERVAASVGAKPEFDFVADLKGFAAKLTRSQLWRLRHSPRVKYVEQDARVEEDATQTGAPWHLDRVDQRALPLDSTYTSTSQGSGVHVYVIDTGIETGHPDFGSRAQAGFDSIGGQPAGTDCNGHGTHVAGIAGGTTSGVAKLATLVAVRVLGCGGSGTSSSVIAGVDWVTAHHAPRSVANMSLGAGASASLDAAVGHMIASGVFLAAAAGNSNANACNHSPARAPAAFTVAASDSADRKASFSNHGSCVDAYAPGAAVTSDWIGGTTKTISGTSMAAPAVAGAAALYLAGHHAATPADITHWLTSNATTGAIANNPADTTNRLLFVGGL